MGYSHPLASRDRPHFINNVPQREKYITRPCCTSCRALAGMRCMPMGPPRGIDSTTYRTLSRCFTTCLKEGRKEMFYLTAHSTGLYGVGHKVLDHSVREETRCRHHMGYSFRLSARDLSYAPFHRQDSTYHGLCYTKLEHWLEPEIAQWVPH